jgi:aspartate/methionine/tyrosine aminotransferase
MINKCSCALDALAKDLKHDDYVTMSTISKAMSIGGERGGVMRDTQSLEAQAKRYRELQTKAKTGCFINSEAR